MLFLPGILAAFVGRTYPNETITLTTLTGGGLILLANLIIQIKPAPKPAPNGK